MKYKYFVFLFFIPITSLADLVTIDSSVSTEDRIAQLTEILSKQPDLHNYENTPTYTQLSVVLRSPNNSYNNKEKILEVRNDNSNLKKKDKIKKSKTLKPSKVLTEKKQLLGINRFEK